MNSERSSTPVSADKTGKSNASKCIVLIGGIYNMFTAIGLMFSINTLYGEILDVFQTTRTETSFVQTIFMGMALAPGLFTGMIVHRAGIKISLMIGAILSFLGFFLGWFATSVPYLIGTLGVISGSGAGLIYISTIVFIAMTFHERRSLALAFIMVGSGLGQILIPLLLGRLLEAYGFRGCLLITSGLYLNVIVCCCLTTSSLGADIPFRLPKLENREVKNGKLRLWRNKVNSMFPVFVFFGSIPLAVAANVVVLFMDYINSQGLSLQTGINIFIGYNVIGLVVRLGAGVLNLNRNVHSLVIYFLSTLLIGCCLLLLKVASNFTSMVVLLCLTGGGHGGMVGLVNIVPIDLVGVENSAIATGIVMMYSGILTPAGGVLIGWVFDSTRSYSLAFDVCGYLTTVSSLATLLAFGVQRFLRRHGKPSKHYHSTEITHM